MTESERKLKPNILAVMFGIFVGALPAFAVDLVDTIINQNSDDIGNKLILLGLACASMVVLGACAAILWMRDSSIRELFQQAKDEENAKSEATL